MQCQVLGLGGSPGSRVLPSVVGWAETERRDMARRVNEYTAGLVATQPHRFGNFATLPLPDIDGAVEEIDYALVSLENLYGYGATAGQPMTEDLPLAATTVKGRTRAAMTQELLEAAGAGRLQIAIGRASDFFGAGITTGTTLGERVFANALAGKRADFIGNPDLPHTYSYVPGIATGLATLGTDARASGGVWHLPGPETVTTRQLLDLLAADVGHPVRVRNLPMLAVRALGLFNPLLRELVEMSYEFDQPFVLDTTKFESTFGSSGTPLAAAVTTTVDWYRSQNGSATHTNGRA